MNWSASAPAKSFFYSLTALSRTLFGVGAANPAPTRFEYCTSSKGSCSNQPGGDASLASASMHFLANAVTDATQFSSPAGKTATTCPSSSVGDAHLRGTKMYEASKVSNPGFAWFDTDDQPVEGCLSNFTTNARLPTGTKAQDRLATFAGTGSSPPAVAKSGTITCPAGFALGGGTFGLARYLCPEAPTNTVPPSVSGTAVQAATLSSSAGTWTPGAPNAPTFAYQWQRCDSPGVNCVDIVGATSSIYTVTPADVDLTLRSVVTATNLDGAASAPSGPTAAVTST